MPSPYDPESQPFMVLAQAASDNLYDLSSQLRRVDRLNQKATNSTGSERLLRGVAALSDKCAELNRVMDQIEAFADQDLGPSERDQRTEFVREFEFLIAKVKQAQSSARATAQQGLPPTSQDSGAGQLESTERTPLMQTQILDRLDPAELDMHSGLISDREHEIAEIQRGMREINIIYQDIGVLVAEQGQQLDSIEDNITELAGQTEEASRQLNKAETYQRSRGRWSCIALLVLLAITILVGINVIA